MITYELRYDRRRKEMPAHPAVLTCEVTDCTAAHSLPRADKFSDGQLAAQFIKAGWDLSTGTRCPAHAGPPVGPLRAHLRRRSRR